MIQRLVATWADTGEFALVDILCSFSKTILVHLTGIGAPVRAPVQGIADVEAVVTVVAALIDTEATGATAAAHGKVAEVAHGVPAVVVRQENLLSIFHSMKATSPNLCSANKYGRNSSTASSFSDCTRRLYKRDHINPPCRDSNQGLKSLLAGPSASGLGDPSTATQHSLLVQHPTSPSDHLFQRLELTQKTLAEFEPVDA